MEISGTHNMSSPFKVGFIVEPYEESEASGMGYSVLETAKALALHAGPYALTLYSSRPLNPQLVPGFYHNVIVPKSLAGKFFRFLLMKKEVDVLFFVVPLLPLWIPKKIRTVAICKELTDHKLKSHGIRARSIVFIRDKLLMPVCMALAVRVLASSEATVRDVVQFYGVHKECIEVISEGYQDWTRFAAKAPPLDENVRPYFLFTGKVKSRKNVHGIIAAFISLKERIHSNCKLLIAGSYGGEYYASLASELKKHHLEQDVHFLGYVSAPMMYTLYVNALALVFPSFNEGFGMPLVEAMSLKLPIISSNISSLAEVTGDAGLLVDPYDTEAISEAMERILGDQNLKRDLVEKGLKRAKLFSWEKVGEKYSAVIHKFQTHVL